MTGFEEMMSEFYFAMRKTMWHIANERLEELKENFSLNSDYSIGELLWIDIVLIDQTRNINAPVNSRISSETTSFKVARFFKEYGFNVVYKNGMYTIVL